MSEATARTPDWEAIERDYRAGVKPLRQIAEENGITHVAIGKRAKRDEWSRDLSAKIAAKADELVTKAAVTKPVTTETRVSERTVVEANATAIVQVRLAHRQDIQRSRTLTMRLLAELESETDPSTLDALNELGDLLRSEDKSGQDKLNDLYRKVISLPGRVKSMKDLGDTLRTLVGLERQAFGILDGDGGDPAKGNTARTVIVPAKDVA